MTLPAVLVDLPDPAADGEALGRLAARLGYTFRRPALLRAALTLPSWTNEHPNTGWPSHACLEFLGDAVLDLVTADALWRRFPRLSEGVLTRLQASVVSEPALAAAARDAGLGDFLYVGKGDRRDGVTHDSLLADALEAVLAAVFLDARAAGDEPLTAAAVAVEALLGPRIAELHPNAGIDAKSRLQQVLQGRHRLTPTYVTVGERTPGPDPQWRVEVHLQPPGGAVQVLGEGLGRSRQLAEQAAAAMALRGLEAAAATDEDPPPKP